MAAIFSSNFYTITYNSRFYNHHHNQRRFRISCANSSVFFLHNRRRRCACQASPKPSNYDFESEEQRWLREEKRWLREEQRWLREEDRWNNERQSLLRQISELSLQIQHLQSELDSVRKSRSNSGDFNADFEVTLTKIAAFLEDKKFNQISDSSISKSNSELDIASVDSSIGLSSASSVESEEEEEKPPLEKTISSLRVGAEGDEVRVLQEALMNLGFYCGEEDMEFSSFSSGTERAVKTWQATIGIREDGIMTVELLDQLYSSDKKSSNASGSSGNAEISKDGSNGAPINVKEGQQTVLHKEPADTDIFQHRVFLLGENRWEEPSRLIKGNDKLGSGGNAQDSAPKCIVCRGEGRLLCMECDGSGEPNIEEQFMDWVEGAKCPYCEGLGYTVCDVCEGNGAAKV
ncbi:unnamed protein product [Amaranthus hypochondriacus]